MTMGDYSSMVFLLKKQRSVLLDGNVNRICVPGWEAAVGRRKEVVRNERKQPYSGKQAKLERS